MSSPFASLNPGYDVPMSAQRPHSKNLSRATTGLLALALGSVLLTSLGCQRALFPKDNPRTQFETYDLMRQRYVPLEAPDVFGEPKPALRARLGGN